MNTIYKILFISILTGTCFAKAVLTIHHDSLGELAELSKTILINDYNLPESLIEISYSTKPCQERSAHLNLCLNEHKKLIVTSGSREIIEFGLKTFRSLEEKDQ